MRAFVLAVGYWAWTAFITFGAGFIGAGLNCDDASECSGDLRWTQPWTLSHQYVFPEVFLIALGGLAFATLFVVFVRRQHALYAAAAFAVSVLLLAYPFFGGLTSDGRRFFWFGPLVGAAALVVSLTERHARVERRV
jgi:hypothetical protein